MVAFELPTYQLGRSGLMGMIASFLVLKGRNQYKLKNKKLCNKQHKQETGRQSSLRRQVLPLRP